MTRKSRVSEASQIIQDRVNTGQEFLRGLGASEAEIDNLELCHDIGKDQLEGGPLLQEVLDEVIAKMQEQPNLTLGEILKQEEQ